MQFWQGLVAEYFAEEGVFRRHLWEFDGRTKAYEVCKAAIARYFWIQFNSGVERIQIFLGQLHAKELPHNQHYVQSDRATYVYAFGNGVQVWEGAEPWSCHKLMLPQSIATGTMKAFFDQHNKLESLEFMTTKHEEYLPRLAITQLFQPDSPAQKASPTMTRGKMVQKEPSITLADIPENTVRDDGVNENVARFFEVGINELVLSV